MTRRSRLLFLCPRAPYPPEGRGGERAYAVLRSLSERYDVALGALVDEREEEAARAALAPLTVSLGLFTPPTGGGKAGGFFGGLRGRPVPSGRIHDRRLADFVRAEREGGVAVEFHCSGAMAAFGEGARAPVAVDLGDDVGPGWSASAASGSGPPGRVPAHDAARLTRLAARTFLGSPEDAAMVRALPGAAGDRVDWFRSGVDTDHWRAEADFAPLLPGADLLIVGGMEDPQGARAVEGFLATVWPPLIAARPGLKLALVGPGAGAALTARHGRDGITVTGAVSDLRPPLAAARIVLSPHTAARGGETTALKAMAMGTPLVLSTAAAMGLGAQAGEHFAVADTPREQVETLSRLLDQPEEGFAMSGRALRFVRQERPWPVVLARLHRGLDEVVSAPLALASA